MVASGLMVRFFYAFPRVKGVCVCVCVGVCVCVCVNILFLLEPRIVSWHRAPCLNGICNIATKSYGSMLQLPFWFLPEANAVFFSTAIPLVPWVLPGYMP